MKAASASGSRRHRTGARPTKVPWVIQDVFPDYHGVAWYLREFTAPANPHPGGRCLLRFEAVDYLADVWLNGVQLGGHEGGETPFLVDATDAIRPRQTNRLAVRVLNPTYEAIDGVALKQTPSGPKHYPVQPNTVYNRAGL
jgi:beta-galactosidase/beta-glucuronidase